MRNTLSLLAAGLLVAFAVSAHAAPADFDVTLSLQVSGFDEISFDGSGVGESVPGGEASIPAGSVVAGFVSRLTTPLLGILTGFAVCVPDLVVVPNPNPAVFPIPPGAGEAVPSCDPLDDGQLDAVVYDGLGGGTGGLLASAYLTNAQNSALVAIPLTLIGVGGEQAFTVLGSPATLFANPWTTDAVTVTGGLGSSAIGDSPVCVGAADPFPCCTGAGVGRCTTFEDAGFDDRDPDTGAGQLKLVTTALTDLGALGTVPAISKLTITYTAPEPGAAAVGLAAFGALGLLAHRRARRS
jgi:hypothetical protein